MTEKNQQQKNIAECKNNETNKNNNNRNRNAAIITVSHAEWRPLIAIKIGLCGRREFRRNKKQFAVYSPIFRVNTN